ncbi:MAG: amidohydrolase [Vicinamibacteraceae bacterium]
MPTLRMKSLPARLAVLTAALLQTASIASAQARATEVTGEIDAVYAQADALYRDLHRQPELSGHEEKTAATLAAGLKALGFEVTTGVGKTGVVGVLKNGAGPVVLLRTELDGLPVEEKTGLDYASTARTKDDNGVDVGLMHACGHDIHMAAWMTTARIMAGTRNRWAGTLVLIGQPAEETLRGAQWMLDDGLLTRFPRPDFGLAIHDDARYPAGLIGYRAGPVLSNSDTIRVTIFGAGGHGARPETTIDPVVIAARTVLALQTIVSREVSPFDSAVITVGTIHAGTKANIIPSEARIELSVRSLTDKVRAHLLSAIDRIVKAEAVAGRSPKEPVIDRFDGTDALVNDAALTQRVSGALLRALGPERVKEVEPEMASEDFSRFHKAGIPTLTLRVGAATPAAFEASEKGGAPLPSLHSPLFAPDRERTLKGAIIAEVLSLRELMPVGSGSVGR